jgi:lipid-A-disaccharide synthase
MRLFISAGEPSGDLHGANLIEALRQRCPDAQFTGLGGERMSEAGCEIIYPLCDLAVVGIWQVLINLSKFTAILKQATAHLRRTRPDAVVLIDYPGFHWHLAAAAHGLAIPVVYYIPPQLWGWAGWRVHKMRRWVDRVLCTLPFEPEWYRKRGVEAEFVGHPYFDELAQQKLDPAFLLDQRRPGTPIVGILPGSRRSELHYNLPTLINAAERIHARRPDVRFLMACLKPEHAERARAALGSRRLPIEIHAGKTPEIIELSHSCMACSGSVSLELLYRRKPTTIIYRQHWSIIPLGHFFKACKYITLVNLLADRELYPEYFGSRCYGPELSGHILRWLDHPDEHAALIEDLTALREKVAIPGSCERAAGRVLDLAGARQRRAA